MPVKKTPAGAHWEFPAPEERYVFDREVVVFWGQDGEIRVVAKSFLQMVEPMGFESTSDMETKEFCGAAWPSKVLKGKRGNS